MPVWTIALDVIEDVRGSIAMYLFIIEEAIQSMGMACYLNYREKNWSALLETANYALENLIKPALDFVSTYGHVAYPLNISYQAFYEATKKQMQNYIDLAKEKLAEA